MKKIGILAICIAILSGCSVTSESYQYKLRFDKFFNLLNDNEKQDFASDRIEKVGLSIDAREKADKKFAADLRNVKVYEAIVAFGGVKTARWYRTIILRELNRENYFKYMDLLSSNEQIAFVREQGMEDIVAQKMKNDKKFAAFMKMMQTEFRLYGFTPSQVNKFFRKVSFAEVSRKQVYFLLEEVKRKKVLKEFLDESSTRDFTRIAAVMEKGNGKHSDIKNVQYNSGLRKLTLAEFIEVYYNIVMMKEMDKGALAKTIAKFI